jgi:hemerythrin superfamily protein
MNAIALLKADHRAVEELFDKLAGLNGKSARNKKSIVEKIIRELSIHAAIEEQIFYPAVRREIPEEREMVLESLEEHNVIKWELDALQSMNVNDERYDAKIKVLKDATLHHIEEEENGLFPKVRESFDNARLNELGTQLERAKKTAPTRPHPRAPDEPPGNLVMNVGAGVIDRARDLGRSVARSARGRAAGSERGVAREGREKRVSKEPVKRASAGGAKRATSRSPRGGSRAHAR